MRPWNGKEVKFFGSPLEAQLEFVLGCNMWCDFCANRTLLSGVQERYYTEDRTIERIAEEIRIHKIKRVVLTGRGEPTIHPRWLEYVQELREGNEQACIMLITNGLNLDVGVVQEYWDAGGSVIANDCYGKGTLERRAEEFAEIGPIVFEKGKSPWSERDPQAHKMYLLQDIREETVTTHQLVNRCGHVDFELVEKYGVYPVTDPLVKRCVDPFRYAVIYYNGDLTVCCREWVGDGVVGNLHDSTLEELWCFNDKMNYLRWMLWNKRRYGIPFCARCDYWGGYYQGFLPKMGTMTEEDERRALELWEGQAKHKGLLELLE